MKKKRFIITISVLVILIIASLITKYIDTANVSTEHEPECCIKIVSQDGNKVTYWGLGYKVVRYVGVSPNEPYENNIGVKMGSWFMKYKDPTNVILDVKSFGGNNTFQISEKADVDFVGNLLKHSKYIDEPCDGIIDYVITYDDYTYDVLISCSEIRKGNKQAKISDKDMEELERILASAADKSRNKVNIRDLILEEPPILTVICGKESVEALRGTSSWTYENDNGKLMGIESDSMHPLQAKEYMKPLKLIPTQYSSIEPLKAYLQWDVVPDWVVVRYWSEESWGDIEAESEMIPALMMDSDVNIGPIFPIDLKKGNYIYEVIADSKSYEKFSGKAHYSFYTANLYDINMEEAQPIPQID